MSSRATSRHAIGRPVVTSHAEIEEAAFRLFAERGFDGTTLDDIAREVGVGRRTLFRYFESKNDIPWGQFDETLSYFRELLASTPEDIPLWQGVHTAVSQFNDFPADARPSHAERMQLILETPALQAHSVLRYGQWRRVIADHVALRTRLDPDDALPSLIGHVSLALALAAYEQWLRDPAQSLPALVTSQMAQLRRYLA